MGKRKREENYEQGRFIGDTMLGELMHCTNKRTKQQAVCKTFEKIYNCSTKFHKELHCLSLSQGHPNVLKLLDVQEDEQSFKLYTEMCIGDLSVVQRHGGLHEEETLRTIAKQILLAIDHCHSKGVLHLDIKPGNLFLSKDMKIKLADFGDSELVSNISRIDGVKGTAGYCAPEMEEEGLLYKISFKSDVYSVGRTLFTLFCGRSNPNLSRVNMSNTGLDLLISMTMDDPQERLSVEEALNHPWFKLESTCEDSEGYCYLFSDEFISD